MDSYEAVFPSECIVLTWGPSMTMVGNIAMGVAYLDSCWMSSVSLFSLQLNLVLLRDLPHYLPLQTQPSLHRTPQCSHVL